MHNTTTHPKVRIRRTIVTGAAVAAALATFGMTGTASAAPFSEVTKADALFICQDECQAGGVGYVAGGGIVVSGNYKAQASNKVGAWERTVYIYCTDRSVGGPYVVTVEDKNWSGKWYTTADSMKSTVNDAVLPRC